MCVDSITNCPCIFFKKPNPAILSFNFNDFDISSNFPFTSIKGNSSLLGPANISNAVYPPPTSLKSVII